MAETGPGAPDRAAGRIAHWLRKIRKTARTLLVAQRGGWIGAGAILTVLVGGFADYFLRSPVQLRLLGLLGAVGVLAWCVARFLLPAMRFRPKLTEIALRVERSGAADDADVRGLLASGLELGRGDDSARTRLLAAPVVDRAATALTAIRARQVFSARPTVRAIGALGAAALLLLGMSVAWPAHTRIGLARMLLPWSSAQWPKHTAIADATAVRHHPMGAALEFRAALLRSDRGAESTNISAHYRVITDGWTRPTRTALLSPQQRTVEARDSAGATVEGTLFERLIEPTGATSANSTARADAAKLELEYWFESDDDETAARRITLVEPPRVVRAGATITLPEYAAAILGTPGASGRAPGQTSTQTVDLGPGTDERAAPAPILAGSRISVTLQLNKPVAPPARLDASTPEGARWIQATLGPEAMLLFAPATPEGAAAPTPGATLTASGRTWTLAWRHWDSVRLLVKPIDAFDIASAEDAAYRFDALKDNPPTATVLTPAEDKSVLATAIVEVSGEARDDVALDWLALERQVARKTPGSEGGVAEAGAERTEFAHVGAAAADARSAPGASPDGAGTSATVAGATTTSSIKRLTTGATLDLSSIPDLKPGDEVWLTASAVDAFALEGQRHEAVRSTVRKLKILSREQLVEQVWGELSTLRRTAIKLDQDQQETAKSPTTPGPAGQDVSARAERAQAGVTERLSRQTQQVSRVQQRVKENGLTDQNVQDVLKQAGESLAKAGEASAKAGRELGDAARSQSRTDARPAAGEGELARSRDAQKGVRDELARLIDMLDQGEDSFASKRALERLLDEQKALRDRTADAGRATAGKTPEQLTPGQQQALDAVAQEQKSLADQLRDQVRKMQDRQSRVREKDAAAADAMQQAAAQSNRDQTPERMDDASRQAQKNQISSAQQQQSEAIQSMQQMIQKMDQAQKNKDEVLKRALANLIDSLKALIVVQEASIDALQKAAPKGTAEIAPLERPMAMHHQNTLGVLEQAGAAGAREVAPVAEKIEHAAGEMALTIPELRGSRYEPALEHENGALAALNEALELADKLKSQAQQKASAQKRAELRSKYEAAMKAQVEIRDSTQGLVGAEDTRRTRATARGLAQEQQTLKETVDAIRQETKDLTGAATFLYAHKRLDDLMGGAGDALKDALPQAGVVRAQTSAARVLKSLAEALDDRKKDDDPFRTGQQAGGGGQGGGGDPPTVPPAAEIVLLRLMQIEALDLVRTSAEAPAPDAGATGEAGKLQREIAEQGAELLKRLQEKSANPGGGARPAPKKARPSADEPAGPKEDDGKPEGGPG